MVFTFIYIFIPNAKVNFTSGLVGGIVAGTLYQLMQWVYIDLQIGVAKYNAIYGSFAVLPLFLVWLQLSWRMVLLGAEISFAHQNVDTYEFEPDCLNVSFLFKRLLTLRIVNMVSKNFAQGNKPFTAQEISRNLDIPIRLVRDILYELTRGGVFTSVQEGTRTPAYQPALDINFLTIKFVMDKLDTYATDSLPVLNTKELKRIKDSLESFGKMIEESPANLLLKEI
ncbi:MAG: YihY/virulence factor BrkB family protein [Candidatus Omnitrophica bacterium]|nr:YihY/virulence factor BrkB family protein [Candidatus Omnitrophota bacterium]